MSWILSIFFTVTTSILSFTSVNRIKTWFWLVNSRCVRLIGRSGCWLVNSFRVCAKLWPLNHWFTECVTWVNVWAYFDMISRSISSCYAWCEFRHCSTRVLSCCDSTCWRAAWTSRARIRRWSPRCYWWHSSFCLMLSDDWVLDQVSLVKICQNQIVFLDRFWCLFVLILMIWVPFCGGLYMRSIGWFNFGYFMLVLFFGHEFLFDSFLDFLNDVLSFWAWLFRLIRLIRSLCLSLIVWVRILWNVSFLVPVPIVFWFFISGNTWSVVVWIKCIPIHFAKRVVHILVDVLLMIGFLIIFYMFLVLSWVILTVFLF